MHLKVPPPEAMLRTRETGRAPLPGTWGRRSALEQVGLGHSLKDRRALGGVSSLCHGLEAGI